MRHQLQLGWLEGVSENPLQGAPHQPPLRGAVHHLLQLHGFTVIAKVQKLATGGVVVQLLERLQVF